MNGAMPTDYDLFTWLNLSEERPQYLSAKIWMGTGTPDRDMLDPAPQTGRPAVNSLPIPYTLYWPLASAGSGSRLHSDLWIPAREPVSAETPFPFLTS